MPKGKKVKKVKKVHTRKNASQKRQSETSDIRGGGDGGQVVAVKPIFTFVKDFFLSFKNGGQYLPTPKFIEGQNRELLAHREGSYDLELARSIFPCMAAINQLLINISPSVAAEHGIMINKVIEPIEKFIKKYRQYVHLLLGLFHELLNYFNEKDKRGIISKLETVDDAQDLLFVRDEFQNLEKLYCLAFLSKVGIINAGITLSIKSKITEPDVSRNKALFKSLFAPFFTKDRTSVLVDGFSQGGFSRFTVLDSMHSLESEPSEIHRNEKLGFKVIKKKNFSGSLNYTLEIDNPGEKKFCFSNDEAKMSMVSVSHMKDQEYISTLSITLDRTDKAKDAEAVSRLTAAFETLNSADPLLFLSLALGSSGSGKGMSSTQ